MFKKINLCFAVAALVMIASCKKEAELPKNDVPIKTVHKHPQPVKHVPPPPPADGKYPVMSFQSEKHDFGTINEGDVVSYKFKFKNTGEANLLITDAKGSCGCTVPEYPKTPIKPGEEGIINVSFNSKGKLGNQTKTVTLFTNIKEYQKVLYIKSRIVSFH